MMRQLLTPVASFSNIFCYVYQSSWIHSNLNWKSTILRYVTSGIDMLNQMQLATLSHMFCFDSRPKESLKLQNSGFVGLIPSELGLCTQLQRLDLATNRFTGTVPLEFERLINLRSLNLQGTSIKGPIPSGICEKGEKTMVQLLQQQMKSLDCSCCDHNY